MFNTKIAGQLLYIYANRRSTMRIGVRHIGQLRSNYATVSAQLPQNRECPHGTRATPSRGCSRHSDFTRIRGVCGGGDAVDTIEQCTCCLYVAIFTCLSINGRAAFHVQAGAAWLVISEYIAHCFLLYGVAHPTIVVFHVCACLLTANYKDSPQA